LCVSTPRLPTSPLFPYTTLFRSAVAPRRRAAVVPAPAADAGLLGVPHRVDGARRAELDLPGPVQPVPAGPGDPRHLQVARVGVPDRKSTRLNSSHDQISYAVFCL